MTTDFLKNHIKEELKAIYTKTEIAFITKQLFLKFLNIQQIDLLSEISRNLETPNIEFVIKAVAKLKNNEPIDYVISEVDFLNLKLWVNQSVLIPRPETEGIAAICKQLWNKKTKPEILVDFGTGSGCIALSLKQIYVDSQVYAIDVSEAALKTAEYNSLVTGLKINILKFDMLSHDNFPIKKEIDILVSNPPYVLHSEKDKMHDRVLKFEPNIALFESESKNLEFYIVLIDYIIKYLKSGGFFVLEFNSSQTQNMLNLFLKFNKHINNIFIHQDCFEKNRFISGFKT